MTLKDHPFIPLNASEFLNDFRLAKLSSDHVLAYIILACVMNRKTHDGKISYEKGFVGVQYEVEKFTGIRIDNFQQILTDLARLDLISLIGSYISIPEIVKNVNLSNNNKREINSGNYIDKSPVRNSNYIDKSHGRSCNVISSSHGRIGNITTTIENDGQSDVKKPPVDDFKKMTVDCNSEKVHHDNDNYIYNNNQMILTAPNSQNSRKALNTHQIDDKEGECERKGKKKDQTSYKVLTPKEPTDRKKANPSVDEVIEYFAVFNMSKDFAEYVHKYYSDANWYDTQNRPVINWRLKMRTVWLNNAKLNGEPSYLWKSNVELSGKSTAQKVNITGDEAKNLWGELK